MTNWQFVILQGEYEELAGEESQQALQLIKTRTTPLMVSESTMAGPGLELHRPVTASRLVLVTYLIRITHKSGRYEKR